MRENIYLAFRGAGARAVLAGVRSPVGSLYYAHANIYIARRAAMPWLDVDSTELFTVADAISAGDNVIIESTTPNAYHVRVGRAVRAAEGEQEGVLTGRWGLNPLK